MAEEEIRVRRGTAFRSVYADGNPLWRVVSARGQGTWDCVVDAGEPDWAGTKKVFGTEEIVRSIRAERFFEGMAAERLDFWASRTEGEILHYHNAFGQYVRGVVEPGFDAEGNDAMVLKPVALVGAWQEWELPRWSDAGFFREGGYHVQKIKAGEAFQPAPGSIYESPDFAAPRGPAAAIDPTQAEPIDLSDPEPTAEQAEAARLLAVVEKMKEVLGSRGEGDFASQYRRRIAEVARIASETELEPGEAPAFRA